eukprot:tig00000718_g3739.t1
MKVADGAGMRKRAIAKGASCLHESASRDSAQTEYEAKDLAARASSSASNPSTRAAPHVQREEAFDGLRGVAVLLVAWSHTSPWLINYYQGMHDLRYYGLFTFFVLSIFLLVKKCLQLPRSLALSLSWWLRFSLKRFARVLPLYYAIIFCISKNEFLNESFSGLVGWTEDYYLLRKPVHVFWTIPMELEAYLIVPLAAVPVQLAPRAAPLVSLALAAAGYGAWQRYPLSTYPDWYAHIWPYSPVFLWAASAAVLGNYLARGPLAKQGPQAGRVGCIACAVARWFMDLACFGLVVLAIWTKHTLDPQPDRRVVTAGLLIVMLVLCLSLSPGLRFSRLLSWSLLVFLGRISYTFYLLHVVARHVVNYGYFAFLTNKQPVEFAMLYFLVSGALGALAHFLVEWPLTLVTNYLLP